MRRLSLVVVTAMLAVMPAHADPTELPVGNKCAFNSMTDVTQEAGWQVGDLRAGPLVTAEAGHLHCSIHVNNDTHSGAEAASWDFDATGGLVVAGVMDHLLQYRATAADDVSLCSTWVGAGGAKYWVGGDTTRAQLGHWSTDPYSPCAPPCCGEPWEPECSVWKAIDNRLGTNIAEIWQDCEPYDPII